MLNPPMHNFRHIGGGATSGVGVINTHLTDPKGGETQNPPPPPPMHALKHLGGVGEGFTHGGKLDCSLPLSTTTAHPTHPGDGGMLNAPTHA